jgi:hypothetical protein
MLIEIACWHACSCWWATPCSRSGQASRDSLPSRGSGACAAQRWLANPTPDIAHKARLAVAAIGLGLAWHVASFAVALTVTASWSPWARTLVALADHRAARVRDGLPFPLG